MNIQDHPTFKQIQQDVAAENQREEQARQEQAMEAQRLRQQQAQLLNREYLAAAEEYEQARAALHEKLGQIWRIANDYSRLTSHYPPTFPENVFMEISVPTLAPSHEWSSPFSTTRTAVMGWFASTGKEWK